MKNYSARIAAEMVVIRNVEHGLSRHINKDVDFADKLSQHFGPILSHMVKDKFTYSIVDKSTSLACS